MKFKIDKALKYLTEYVDTYSNQKNYKQFNDNIWIDDILYGLGMSIDPKKYKFASGYKEFKKALLEKLNKDVTEYESVSRKMSGSAINCEKKGTE